MNDNKLSFLRELSESTGNADDLKLKFDDDTTEFEADEQFMQECMAACLPTMVQMMIMDEDAEAMDEATREAFVKVNDYFVGQGIIDEAASVNLSNPKVTFIKMGRDAQIHRLSTIITLKLARRDSNKAYKKYKVATKLKKENMAILKQRYGAKADKLAKKLYQKLLKSKKAAAVVTDTKNKKK